MKALGGGGGSYSSTSKKYEPKAEPKKPKPVQGLSHSQLMAQWEANGRDAKTGKLIKHVETKAVWTKADIDRARRAKERVEEAQREALKPVLVEAGSTADEGGGARRVMAPEAARARMAALAREIQREIQLEPAAAAERSCDDSAGASQAAGGAVPGGARGRRALRAVALCRRAQLDELQLLEAMCAEEVPMHRANPNPHPHPHHSPSSPHPSPSPHPAPEPEQVLVHNGAEELAALRGALERLEELGLMEGGEEGLEEEEEAAEEAEEAEGEEGVALLRAVAAGPPLEYSFQATAEPPEQPDAPGAAAASAGVAAGLVAALLLVVRLPEAYPARPPEVRVEDVMVVAAQAEVRQHTRPSPYLPYLPISPHISPHLPTSPHAQVREDKRLATLARLDVDAMAAGMLAHAAAVQLEARQALGEAEGGAAPPPWSAAPCLFEMGTWLAEHALSFVTTRVE